MDTMEADKRIMRARQMNTFRNFIMQMVDYRKLYIVGLQGCVVTPFIGTSLAADFRLATNDMKFSLAHIKYKLHPSGALPFFLERYVGHGKATEILLTGGEISAQEAYNLGMVNEILPKEDFENKCIEKAKKLCVLGPTCLRITKKLTYNFRDELERYFDIESKIVGF